MSEPPQDVPGLPYHMIRDPALDADRLALFPSLDYRDLHDCVYEFIPELHLGTEQMNNIYGTNYQWLLASKHVRKRRSVSCKLGRIATSPPSCVLSIVYGLMLDFETR